MLSSSKYAVFYWNWYKKNTSLFLLIIYVIYSCQKYNNREFCKQFLHMPSLCLAFCVIDLWHTDAHSKTIRWPPRIDSSHADSIAIQQIWSHCDEVRSFHSTFPSHSSDVRAHLSDSFVQLCFCTGKGEIINEELLVRGACFLLFWWASVDGVVRLLIGDSCPLL